MCLSQTTKSDETIIKTLAYYVTEFVQLRKKVLEFRFQALYHKTFLAVYISIVFVPAGKKSFDNNKDTSLPHYVICTVVEEGFTVQTPGPCIIKHFGCNYLRSV